MMKIKLFYSYSHKDEDDRDELEKHLKTLKNNNLIDEWHDRKIIAGSKWEKEINSEMENANIILLLFSHDFIASKSCQKEVNKALDLEQDKDTVFIPIILKKCAWTDVTGMSNILALPKDGKPVNLWDDKDTAWNNVYQGIKKQVEKLKGKMKPTLKDDFKETLLKNPIMDCTLDKLFVFPDILEINKSEQKLENNEINSEKLKDIKTFKDSYILIEGEEQSGKTSLCRMLYLHYEKTDFYPIMINGKDITGKADIKNIVNKAHQKQYDSNTEYWSLAKEKRILIIDDANYKNANDKNYAIFLQSIKENFEHAIILIDELSNLSNKSAEHNYFYLFNDYSIKSLGYAKRDELIKKCIANDEDVEFNTENKAQIARLDKDTRHVNAIIGSNLVPSYPFFIVSAFNIIEYSDMKETSYGHCYHAMITMQLYRANIKAGNMDEYFKFLTEFSYFIFKKNKNSASQNELDEFIKAHKENYFFDEKIIANLISSSSLINKNNMYSFQYIYTYYYFVAKYLADHINEQDIKYQIKGLLSNIHKKDSSNIIVFITHHTEDEYLLDSILLNTMANFKKFSVASLKKNETKFITKHMKRLENITIPSENHNPENTRQEELKRKDISKPTVDKLENEAENEDENLLLIEIRKSAKSIEIIGQIMINQSGTFKKDMLSQLFREGQNSGLRLLKSFIDLMNNNENAMDEIIQQRISDIAKEKGLELSKDEIKSFVTRFSYSIIFGWLYKIVDSLGSNKLIEIFDKVDNQTNTPASKLINFSIHAWYKKEIDFNKLKLLCKDFDNDENYTAKYILKDIVSRHIYMHKLDFKEKQKINSLLGFDVKEQLSVQSKLK